MLRQIVIALRWSLVVLGLALLCLWPVSYVRGVAIQGPWPRGNIILMANRGTCHVLLVGGPDVNSSPLRVDVSPPLLDLEGPSLVPEWHRFTLPPGSFTQFLIPLWLLSAVCLAWPVTTFLLAARHRGKRGFEVTVADEADEGSPH